MYVNVLFWIVRKIKPYRHSNNVASDNIRKELIPLVFLFRCFENVKERRWKNAKSMGSNLVSIKRVAHLNQGTIYHSYVECTPFVQSGIYIFIWYITQTYR